MRADASDADRPWVTDVRSLSAVSWAERTEWPEVIDCEILSQCNVDRHAWSRHM
jgi:hypothetical protein